MNLNGKLRKKLGSQTYEGMAHTASLRIATVSKYLEVAYSKVITECIF